MKRGCGQPGLAAACAGLLAGLVLALASGAAEAQQTYVVEGVSVDVTAETAANARDRAIEQATRIAFDRLTERLATESGFGPAPSVSGAALQNLVEGIEFANEKSSAVRYLADITVRFRPHAVRSLYGRGGTAYEGGQPRVDLFRDGPSRQNTFRGGQARGGGPPLLVVPVFEMGGTRVIWEEFNPWWVAWEQGLAQGRSMRLMLPRGDAGDLGALTAEQAATGERSRILALADRHAAAGALVARATVDGSGGAPALSLVVTSFGGAPTTMGLVDRVQGATGESVDEVARRAVAKVIAMIDESATGGALAPPRAASSLGTASIEVVANLESSSDLHALRRRLQSVVAREELVSLSRGRARLRLFHSGDREMLRGSLSRAGIVVTDTPEGWTLSLPGPLGGSPTALSPAQQDGR